MPTTNTPDEREPATGFAVIPYIQGVTEPIKRILNSHTVKVAQKPFQTLGHERTTNRRYLFYSVITSMSDRPNVSLVYV